MGSRVSKGQMFVLNSSVATHSGLRHHYPSLGMLQNLPFYHLSLLYHLELLAHASSLLKYLRCPDSLRIILKMLAMEFRRCPSFNDFIRYPYFSNLDRISPHTLPRPLQSQWLSCCSSNKPSTIPPQAS